MIMTMTPLNMKKIESADAFEAFLHDPRTDTHMKQTRIV